MLNDLFSFWVAIFIEPPFHETNSTFEPGDFGIFENQSVIDRFDQVLFHFEVNLQIVKQSPVRIETRRRFSGIGSIKALWFQRLCFFMQRGLLIATFDFESIALLYAFFLTFY